ncbi:MAG: FecR family protein [Mangrovibacterium sp.]
MEQVPIHQILKSFEGRLVKNDSAVLNEWLLLSEANKDLYEELRKAYSTAGKLTMEFEPDSERALLQVTRRIKVHHTIRMLWQSAAAAVILIILSTQLISQLSEPTDWQEVTALERQTVILPDSSKVVLAPNARVQYPTQFAEKLRTIKLEGSAYFEINRNLDKPFKISTKNTLIEVLGTKFMVEAQHPDLERVLVDEGKVAFSSGSVFSRKKVILSKNEIGIWDAENHQLSEQINPEQNANAWLSGRLSFSNQPLYEVIKTLEKHFNIDLNLTDANFAGISYSGQFNTSNPEDIVKTICQTLNLSYTKNEPNFVIKP